MIILRMLTGLAMLPMTLVLKPLALWRRNRIRSFFQVSCMPYAQYPVRIEFRGMCIDLPPEQAARLAEALQEPGPDGPGEFCSRQGLHQIRWHRQGVRIQRLSETVEVPGAVSGIWLNKRSAINLRRRILHALAVAVHHGFIPVVPGDVPDNPFAVGERVVLQCDSFVVGERVVLQCDSPTLGHRRPGNLVGTVMNSSPTGTTVKWDNGPTCCWSNEFLVAVVDRL